MKYAVTCPLCKDDFEVEFGTPGIIVTPGGDRATKIEVHFDRAHDVHECWGRNL